MVEYRRALYKNKNCLAEVRGNQIYLYVEFGNKFYRHVLFDKQDVQLLDEVDYAYFAEVTRDDYVDGNDDDYDY